MSFPAFLGYQFKNEKLLEIALTHKSYAYELMKDQPLHNEKLEFLGDAVLDLILSEYLMETFPDRDEGDLSKLRAHLVNESGLALQARKLSLSKYLRMGKGEVLSGGSEKPRLLASTFEALVGALFTEAGFAVARQGVREIFAEQIAELQSTQEFDQDYKSQLQELAQGLMKQVPVYQLKSQFGPAHDRIFEVQVIVQTPIGDQVLAVGQGKTKKAAEQSAAALGLQSFKQLNKEFKGSDV
jgi:ribonuclease-3